VIGRRTLNAVRSYQKSKGLATGGLTMETLKALGVSLGESSLGFGQRRRARKRRRDMEAFIRMAMKQLGTSEETTRSAAGGVLQLIKSKVSEGDFNDILNELPGASDLLGAVSPPTGAQGGSGGGMLGGMLSKASSLVGGSLGGKMEAVAALSNAGLDQEKIGPFVSLFANFAKQELSGDLLGRIAGQFPEIKALLD
jgi:hypothetical protein